LGHKEGQGKSILLRRAISLHLLRRKNPGTNSATGISRTMMRNIAVFMLTWFLAIGFHALTHVHEICIEHGEWLENTHNEIHSEFSKIHTDPEDTQMSFRVISEVNIHLKHRHCPCLRGLSQIQVSPATEDFCIPRLTLNQKIRVDEHVSVSKISILRIAQKTSPPASNHRV
jgi:hypothetical protein